MNHELTTAAAADPVSLSEAKAHLREDAADRDDEITRLVKAATAHLDGYAGVLGRALVTQSWTLTLDSWPLAGIPLPLAPVQSITAIRYRDTNGDTQTVSASDYRLSGSASRPVVHLNSGGSWPTVDKNAEPIEIEYVAGYGAADEVPEPIRHAILLHVGAMYDHEKPFVTGTVVAQLPLAHDALIRPYRRVLS